MTDVSVRCEKSFYKELYHFGSGKCSLVIDTVSERLWLRKAVFYVASAAVIIIIWALICSLVVSLVS